MRDLVLPLPSSPLIQQVLQRLMIHRTLELMPRDGSMVFRVEIVRMGEEENSSSLVKKKRVRGKDVHMSHLPAYRKVKSEETMSSPCAICFGEWEVGEYVRELPLCNHVFHKKCVDRWMKQDQERMSCPLCRTSHKP
jgi:hypothetical protein